MPPGPWMPPGPGCRRARGCRRAPGCRQARGCRLALGRRHEPPKYASIRIRNQCPIPLTTRRGTCARGRAQASGRPR